MLYHLSYTRMRATSLQPSASSCFVALPAPLFIDPIPKNASIEPPEQPVAGSRQLGSYSMVGEGFEPS